MRLSTTPPNPPTHTHTHAHTSRLYIQNRCFIGKSYINMNEQLMKNSKYVPLCL